MSQTPHLKLDYLLPEQAQKHITVNDALRRLDGLVQLSVKNRTTIIPPSEPENGDRYLVGPQAQGAWEGQAAIWRFTRIRLGIFSRRKAAGAYGMKARANFSFLTARAGSLCRVWRKHRVWCSKSRQKPPYQIVNLQRFLRV